MKLFHAVVTSAAMITAASYVSLGSTAVLAQDSTFLACARHTDRGQRIACLEDALDAALAAQDAQGNQRTAQPPPAPARTPAPEIAEAPPQNPAPATPPTTTPTAPTVTTAEPGQRTTLLDRIRAFGQDDEAEASLSTDASGNDRLHDTITALEKRNEMWTVTLSSGQVWRQVYPRTLNLRTGDEISIYKEGMGDGYRLATPRLNGFIRVERSQ